MKKKSLACIVLVAIMLTSIMACVVTNNIRKAKATVDEIQEVFDNGNLYASTYTLNQTVSGYDSPQSTITGTFTPITRTGGVTFSVNSEVKAMVLMHGE